MKVSDIFSCLRNCTVNFIYNHDGSNIGSVSIYSSGSCLFSDINIKKSELLSLTVNDVYAMGRGFIIIYVS